MIRIGHPDDPNAFRRTGKLPDGTPVGATYLFADPAKAGDGPDAYVVRQPPHSFLPAHYHFSRQFQMVIEGSGTLGRHDIAPFSVHYAAAETGYGPICAGDDGLDYLTFRQIRERGAQYLPEGIKAMTAGLHRRQTTQEAGTANPAGEGLRELIRPDETGLAAWQIDVAAGKSSVEPGGEGFDRYVVVTAGSCILREDMLPAMSVVWLSDAEPVQTFEAGPEGAQLIVLRFPREA